MDNLNTHTISSLYDTFAWKKAFESAQRLEIHNTPNHGSWFDIAEIELSALGRQCPGNRRIPDLETVRNELSYWYRARNASQKGVNWRVTTDGARSKLKQLYPVPTF
jgi:hypothetical protein